MMRSEKKRENEKERTKRREKMKALLGIEHLPLHRAKYFFLEKNTMGRFLQTITEVKLRAPNRLTFRIKISALSTLSRQRQQPAPPREM